MVSAFVRQFANARGGTLHSARPPKVLSRAHHPLRTGRMIIDAERCSTISANASKSFEETEMHGCSADKPQEDLRG